MSDKFHESEPRFTPERVDQETIRTNFLELSGDLAKSDLVAEIDIMDTPIITSSYRSKGDILSILGESGDVTIYHVGRRGEPPRNILGFQLGLGELRRADIGPYADSQESIAAVTPAVRPSEVALMMLTEGGQFCRPEVINVLAPRNEMLAEPDAEVTAIALGEDETANYLAIAYGHDLIIHRLGSDPGRRESGIMTPDEHARLTERMAADAAARGIEYEPAPYRTSWNIRTQELDPWWHRRFEHRITAVDFGEVYNRHGEAAVYVTRADGAGGAYGIDYNHWPKALYPNSRPEHPWKPPLEREFRLEYPSDVLAAIGSGSEKIVSTENGAHLSHSNQNNEQVLSTIRMAAGRRLASADNTGIRYLTLCTREPEGPGGTVTLLDRFPHWDRH